jgi:hypothetical protein
MEESASKEKATKPTHDKGKKDDKVPTVRIVIETNPSGSGYTSDGGDGLQSHPDKSALMDHLSSALPDDEGAEQAEEEAAEGAGPTDAPSTPPSSLMDSIKALTSKK